MLEWSSRRARVAIEGNLNWDAAIGATFHRLGDTSGRNAAVWTIETGQHLNSQRAMATGPFGHEPPQRRYGYLTGLRLVWSSALTEATPLVRPSITSPASYSRFAPLQLFVKTAR